MLLSPQRRPHPRLRMLLSPQCRRRRPLAPAPCTSYDCERCSRCSAGHIHDCERRSRFSASHIHDFGCCSRLSAGHIYDCGCCSRHSAGHIHDFGCCSRLSAGHIHECGRCSRLSAGQILCWSRPRKCDTFNTFALHLTVSLHSGVFLPPPARVTHWCRRAVCQVNSEWVRLAFPQCRQGTGQVR